jgi:spermidine/putrescine transport system substrate-binding protein
MFLGLSYATYAWYVSYNNQHASNDKRSLTILSWMGTFDLNVIRRFEEQSGIQINLSYYASNEELLSKMKLTKGKGIDIIVPSDYAITMLKEDNLITPLIADNIPSIKHMYHRLIRDFYIDDNKIIAVPIEWGVYGIAYTSKVKNEIKSEQELLDVLFGRANIFNQRVCMSNDSMAACCIAHLYYKYQFENEFADNNAKYTVIYEMLKKQYPFIRSYSDTRIAYLFETDEIDMAYIQTDEFVRALEKSPDLEFTLTPCGTIKTAEYIALSSQAKNISEAYEFVNYILSLNVMAENIKRIGYFPVRKDFNKALLEEKAQEIIEKVFSDKTELTSIEKILSNEDRISLWTLLKSGR